MELPNVVCALSRSILLERTSMKKLIAVGALITAAIVSVVGTLASAQSPTVQIDGGPLVGDQADDLISFRGIPYAAPPVGELRWRPPQAPKAWTEPLDATKFRERCPQNGDLGVFATRGGAEDCLYLNVFVSRQSGTACFGI
jgi:para-nitrobenzyl esterase